jgi:tetratricopeptide (TPR) repeat protein
MAADPRRVKELFFAALDLSDRQARQAFLERECGDEADLRQRLEVLLKAHDDPASVLDQPLSAEGPATAAYHGQAEDVGAVIAGRYKLLEQIGEGGMGTVWVAEQTQPVRRKVALKLIKPGMDSKTVLSRFEAERQALALMDHPNIAKVLDGGTTESCRPFFVMEYVKGVPFNRYCDDAHLSVAQRLVLFVPICQAVQHAHQKGIIHRDLKPSNILVCLYDGKPVAKVIDFGLAKAMHQPLTEHTLYTAHGVLMGTPLYMSPEQAELNNLDVDTRTDIYALGVILYELLTGTTPLEKQRFKEAAWHEMLRLIKEEEPQRPSARLSGSGSLPTVAAQRQLEPVKLTRLVRGELDWIVMKCLEKDRSRRYDTANGLARDVEHYLADELVEAQPPSAGYRFRKFVRRNKGRVVAAGLVAAMLFLLIGLIVYGTWWAERQSAERRQEQALTVARNNDTLNATLNQIQAALKAGRLEEAGTLLGQADKQTDAHTPADLRERHELLKRDEGAIRELNEIFEERWMISRSDTRLDNTRAKGRYPRLFQSYGLVVGMEPAAATEARIRQSLIAEALSAALTEWFFVDPKYPGLLAVVDSLDPDPVRATLRTAIVNDDNDRVKEIGKTIDGSRLAPAYAIGFGTHPAIKDGLPILKAAWTAHPDSFALALTISSRLSVGGQDEAVGWSRTAVALRPNNPLPHYYLALALTFVGHSSTTEELRRAIHLAPRFARAYGQLAMILHRYKNAEALDVARKAIDLDVNSLYGHLVILMDLMDKKDYVEAAKFYQRIAGLSLVDESMPVVQSYEGGRTDQFMSMAIDTIQVGLIRAGRPCEAYRLEGTKGNDRTRIDGEPFDFYNPACAAALAGTGQGLDAPPPAERLAIRKRALEWLTSSFNVWKNHAAAFPALSASSAGLISSQFGHGPLLAASALLSGSPHLSAEQAAKYREVAYERMNKWLSDSDLAGVRDDQWLDKLQADEREQWRKFWSEIRSLRDRTAPPKPATPPAGE